MTKRKDLTKNKRGWHTVNLFFNSNIWVLSSLFAMATIVIWWAVISAVTVWEISAGFFRTDFCKASACTVIDTTENFSFSSNKVTESVLNLRNWNSFFCSNKDNCICVVSYIIPLMSVKILILSLAGHFVKEKVEWISSPI